MQVEAAHESHSLLWTLVGLTLQFVRCSYGALLHSYRVHLPDCLGAKLLDRQLWIIDYQKYGERKRGGRHD